MIKREILPPGLLCILVIAVLAAPVAGLVIADDMINPKITATDGTTSPMIILDYGLIENGAITIDITELHQYVASGNFTTDNVVIDDAAVTAGWTVDIADHVMTLTLTGRAIIDPETVTVTFTGATNPWIAYTTGEKTVALTATITDTSETASFNFVIQTGGLAIENGVPITATDGATSPVITITDAAIDPEGTITIDVSNLNWFVVASGLLSMDNVVIEDNTAADWSGEMSDENTLMLTSAGPATEPGDMVTVTFTGTAGNPWIDNTGGPQSYPLPVTRTDGLGVGTIDFAIETGVFGGLSITNGDKIIVPNGATSPVITITDTEIAKDNTITINVADIQEYVASGPLTKDNIVVKDTADAAIWTGVIDGNILTLTSTQGVTFPNDTVTVTFTGELYHWVTDSHGDYIRTLKATRTDTGQFGTFDFAINTTPPIGSMPEVDFSATPTSGIPPLSVSFADTSKGRPTEWSWDFGDGTTSTDQNPCHIYTQPGLYSVTLTVWNKYSMGLVSKTNYITVINGAIVETDTEISGLTIANCKGPQTITVNTSVLPAVLSSGTTVLEIHPPAESGFKTITFFTDNRIGFSQNGDLITGKPTGVHLVSVEIAPTSGFSDTVGKASSFSYSIDLPSYPCKGKLTTKIWEGAVPKYDSLLWRVASENNASPVGTAYTAEITKTNFPSNARVKLTMSVDRGWSPSTFGEHVFIWRIADDEKSGQIFNTRGYSDPVNNLDYYEADSPEGLSTFGLSSFDGSNNPFQMIAFAAANVVNWGSGSGTNTVSSPNYEPGVSNPDTMQRGPVQEPVPAVTANPPALTQPAMTTNIGMAWWLLAMIRDNPIILVGVVGVIAVVAYFGWWKRRL